VGSSQQEEEEFEKEFFREDSDAEEVVEQVNPPDPSPKPTFLLFSTINYGPRSIYNPELELPSELGYSPVQQVKRADTREEEQADTADEKQVDTVGEEQADTTEEEADNTEEEADNTEEEADNTEEEATNTEEEATNTEEEADNTEEELERVEQALAARYPVNTFVVAMYEAEWLVAQVVDKATSNIPDAGPAYLHLSYMRKLTGDMLKWPDRPDILNTLGVSKRYHLPVGTLVWSIIVRELITVIIVVIFFCIIFVMFG
jgi:hypothetical protein